MCFSVKGFQRIIRLFSKSIIEFPSISFSEFFSEMLEVVTKNVFLVQVWVSLGNKSTEKTDLTYFQENETEIKVLRLV